MVLFKYALNECARRYLSLFLITVIFTSCVSIPPPEEDFTLARTALEAARQIEAARYSPLFFQQAENHYKKAQSLFDDREYDKAQQEFIQCRRTAEKAETAARIQMLLHGEVK
jgi:hypothetical protein